MADKPTGNASARDYGDDFAQLHFVVSQIAGRMATVELVRVVAVHNTGDVAPVGLIDVQPLVHQTDGAGKAVEHGIIHDVPYARVQGGAYAVILDPKVDDIGIAVFAARDISKVKNTKAPALPGSKRRFDWADALYIGGVLNAAPTAYIRFTSTGDIELKPTATVKVLGDLDVTGDVTASGTSLHTHQHGGVQTGSGDTGAPI